MTTVITQLHNETRPAYLLRVASAFILNHNPSQPIYYDDYDEEADGETLARDCIALSEELSTTNLRAMEFTGRIIQAGGDSATPTLTIETTREQLKACPSIPFYQRSLITIIPL